MTIFEDTSDGELCGVQFHDQDGETLLQAGVLSGKGIIRKSTQLDRHERIIGVKSIRLTVAKTAEDLKKEAKEREKDKKPPLTVTDR